MDITETTAPRSDQQNFDDYVSGSKTVTVSEVRAGTAEQPVEIHLLEFPGRPFKPSKTVRRILVAAWGAESSNYIGRRMTLYGDPTIRFGGAVVGGIRVSHLSHIDKPLTISLTETRGKRKPHHVEPLPDEPEQIARDEPPVTPPQLQKLSILRQREGYADDEDGRADWFRWVQVNISRHVATNKELTKAEASVLIDVLESAEGGT